MSAQIPYLAQQNRNIISEALFSSKNLRNRKTPCKIEKFHKFHKMTSKFSKFHENVNIHYLFFFEQLATHRLGYELDGRS